MTSKLITISDIIKFVLALGGGDRNPIEPPPFSNSLQIKLLNDTECSVMSKYI